MALPGSAGNRSLLFRFLLWSCRHTRGGFDRRRIDHRADHDAFQGLSRAN